MRSLRLLAAAAVLGLALASASVAAAAGKPAVPNAAAFGLLPVGTFQHGYFVYGGARGQVLRGRFRVDNYGNRTGTVKLYPADATTGQTSGTVYLTSGSRPSAVGSWISLNKSALTLAPRKSWTVSFAVHVPANATPGEHIGGIVAETVHQVAGPSSKGKANVQIRVRNLSIVAVQVNVPGPTHAALALGAVTVGGSHGYQKLFVRLRNTGNLMVKGHGALVVRAHAGAKALSEPLALDTTLPQTAIALPVLVHRRALPVGRYAVHIRLAYTPVDGGAGGIVDAVRAFTISPQTERQVFRSSAPLRAPSPHARPHRPKPKPTPKAEPTSRPTPQHVSSTPPTPVATAPPQPATHAGLPALEIAALAGGGVFLLLAGYLVAVWHTRRLRT